MAAGEPTQEFPTRAALRRARLAAEQSRSEVQSRNQGAQATLQAEPAGPGAALPERDEFDDVAELAPLFPVTGSLDRPVDTRSGAPAAGSDSAGSDSAEPDSAGSDSAEPDNAEPDSAEPDSAEPDNALASAENEGFALAAHPEAAEGVPAAGQAPGDRTSSGGASGAQTSEGPGARPAIEAPASEASPSGTPVAGDAASAPAVDRGPEATGADSAAAAAERETFLRPEDEALPPTRGVRGFLSRIGFTVEPSAEEKEERQWRRAIGRRLSAPRTVSVVNGKGGANKTPTAVLLSAVFGRNSGDPVLVWDNNGTRGTLGWRTVKASHDAHVMDLLHAAPDLMDATAGDPAINAYVHYQPEDRYSVLRTDPTLLASEQNLTAADFDAVHAAASKFFQLSIVDSGNDESAERWLRMIDHTDQLVIASTTVEEHAEAAALLLEALANRGGRYAELARNAVVIVSQHQQNGNKDQLARIASGFRRLARAVVTVPFDPSLVKGQIRYQALRPATRRAWLEAAAAVADGLS